VAPAQPEGDVSSAGMSEPREAWVESRMPRPHEARWISAMPSMMGRRGGGWSDRLGWQSDRQPLFPGRSDCPGSRSDSQPLFSGRTASSGQWREPLGTRGADSGAGMGAAPEASSCRKMSKSLVRQGETAKGKTASSKTTCRKMTMLLVERSRH
jgi:hypothetical protein